MKPLPILAVIFFASAGGAWADCNDAIEDYNNAINEVFYRLKKYADCVEASKAQDDCYIEFRRLKNAQGEFESAVSNYKYDCE